MEPIRFKKLLQPFKSPLIGGVRKSKKDIDLMEEIRLYQLGLKQLDDKQRILKLIEKWRTVAKGGLENLRNLVSVQSGVSVTLAEMALMVKGIEMLDLVQIGDIAKYDPEQDEFVDENSVAGKIPQAEPCAELLEPIQPSDTSFTASLASA